MLSGLEVVSLVSFKDLYHGYACEYFSLLFVLDLVIFQAWIEASTKGAVLLFTASEVESGVVSMGISPAAAGLVGGMSGGIAQAYATMGKSLLLLD